ncbi:MAG: MotA/TolQ/ExbB proton channel family protein, partial [Candidatus Riflemargulisbacteria bacterium]
DNKRYSDAVKFCQKNPSLIGDLYLSILNNREKSKLEIEEIAERHVLKILVVLEHKLNFIATVGSTTPFIGLFGTVFGIIKTFLGMSYAHGYSPTVVTSGIAEALLNTAAGLFVAIPAVVAYNYFSYQIRVFLRDAEITISEMIENLEKGDEDVIVEKHIAKIETEIDTVKVEQKTTAPVPAKVVSPAANNKFNKNNAKNKRR